MKKTAQPPVFMPHSTRNTSTVITVRFPFTSVFDYEKIIKFGNRIDRDAETEFEFWDKIDLSEYIQKYTYLYDLRDALEEKFGKQFLDETGIDCVFNAIDGSDFAQYLNNKSIS